MKSVVICCSQRFKAEMQEWREALEHQHDISILLIPDFGKDRLRLQEIQQSMEGAYKLVLANIANRELPQLLSRIIIYSQTL